MGNDKIDALLVQLRQEILLEAEEELRRQIRQETAESIAAKMDEDGMEREKILRYTGVSVPERGPQPEEYDAVAKQVAAEMLMRGLSVDAVQMATRLPRGVIRELQQQFAGFFS